MRKFLAILMSLALMLSVGVSCKNNGEGSEEGGQIVDPNKEQIVFSVFNGGYGYQWAMDIAKEWNETNDKYQVVVSPNKDEWYTLSANLEAGTSKFDIILNTASYGDLVQGRLEDLTDIVTTIIPGESKSIHDKSKDIGNFENNYKYRTYGYYAIPLFNSVCGFVYDHEIFKEKCFLIGTNGDVIDTPTSKLSVGRDGVEGTVDDGQPVTLTEWDNMIDAIKSSGLYTFLWSGKFSYYTEPLFFNIFYDYAGKENVENIFYGLNGSYTNPKTKQVTTITSENGYEVYKMAGYYEAFKFIDDYLADPNLYHPASAQYSTSHTDAQKTFVYGNAFNGATSDKQVAFLYEGSWWENESRANFNSLEQRGNTDYKYGTRDYRMMFPPKLDENGVYKDRPLVTFDDMNLSVKKQTSSEKLAAIKDFILTMYKDENLIKFTQKTGAMINYNFDIPSGELTKMTKFIQNVYALFKSDSYLVGLKNQPKSPVSRGNICVYSGNSTQYPINFFLRGPGISTVCNANQAYEGTYNYYKDNWNTFSRVEIA